MRVRIVGADLPGPAEVHVGVQRGKEVVDLVAADAPEAVFEFDVEVRPGRDGRRDFFGPYVHGRPGKRFMYLSWGTLGDDGSFQMFRRAKLWLEHLGDEAAGADTVEGRVGLTDPAGGPLCGGLAPGVVQWRAVR